MRNEKVKKNFLTIDQLKDALNCSVTTRDHSGYIKSLQSLSIKIANCIIVPLGKTGECEHINDLAIEIARSIHDCNYIKSFIKIHEIDDKWQIYETYEDYYFINIYISIKFLSDHLMNETEKKYLKNKIECLCNRYSVSLIIDEDSDIIHQEELNSVY